MMAAVEGIFPHLYSLLSRSDEHTEQDIIVPKEGKKCEPP